MKNNFTIFLCFLLLIVSVGCIGGSGPEDTVQAYFERVAEGDYEEAVELTNVEETEEEMIIAGMKLWFGQIADEIDYLTYEVVEEDGDNAVVEVGHTEEEDSFHVELNNVDGEWKIDHLPF